MLKGLQIILSMTGILGFAAVAAQGAVNPKILMKTSKGDITVELFQDKAPITVKNFLSYVDEKFFDGTIFHRVINGFMIQGGGMTTEMAEKESKAPIKNEATNRVGNDRGTIAMARTGIIDSATCQFFINHKNNSGLNHKPGDPDNFGYAVFGKVVSGMDVVDAIASVPTTTRKGHQDVPVAPVVVLSATRL